MQNPFTLAEPVPIYAFSIPVFLIIFGQYLIAIWVGYDDKFGKYEENASVIHTFIRLFI